MMRYFNKRVPLGALPDNEAANAKSRAGYWRRRLPETTRLTLLEVKKRSANSELAQDAVVYAHYCESDMRIFTELYGALSKDSEKAEALYSEVKSALVWLSAYTAGTDAGTYTRQEGYSLMRKHCAQLLKTHKEFVRLLREGIER